MSTITVSTSAELVSALRAAQAGDTVQLAAGTYAPVSLENLHFATDVTITSADPTQAAVMTNLHVKAVNGLTFQGLDFTVSGPVSTNAVTVETSQDVHFDGVHVHGTLDNDPSNDGGGILLRGSSDVSVTNATFEQLHWGVAHLDSTTVNVSGNQFHDLRTDGVRGGGSSFVTISGNHFTSFHPAAGDHSDAIQFWTTGTIAAGHDILVENNVFERGDGDVAQGVFMRDEGKLKPYEHVVIRGNLISGGMYNGIVVFGAHDVTIDGNVVQGFDDMKSWIQVSRTDGAVLTNNSANEILFTDTATNVTNLGSTILGLATDRGSATTAQWHADHLLAPTSPPLVPTVPTVPVDPTPGGGGVYPQVPGLGPILLPDFSDMNMGFNGWANFA